MRAAATKKFRLIVVDSRPLNDGLETLAALSPYVRCVHTPLSGAAVTMREATRVILGMHIHIKIQTNDFVCARTL